MLGECFGGFKTTNLIRCSDLQAVGPELRYSKWRHAGSAVLHPNFVKPQYRKMEKALGESKSEILFINDSHKIGAKKFGDFKSRFSYFGHCPST